MENRNINILAFNSASIFAGTSGKGVFRANLSDFGITNVEEDSKKTFLTNLIYPNPALDFIEIPEMTNKIGSNVIEVYSVLNLKVLEFEYSEQIDISTLSSGVYFLKVENKIYQFIKL